MESQKVETLKVFLRAFFIYNALENGWTVKKSKRIANGFEFTTDPYESDFPLVPLVRQRRRCISAPQTY